MKNLITMFMLSLITGMAYSQATVTIHVTPFKTDTLGLFEDNHYTDITPSKNGDFIFHFKDGLPKWVTIESYKRERFLLYIEKGDHLNIVTSLNRAMPVFSGKGAANASTSYQIYNTLKDNWNAIDDSTVKAGTATDLNNRFELMFQKGFHLLKENKKQVTPAFYKSEFAFLYYQSLSFRLDVPYWYMQMAGQKLSSSIPDHYWDLAKLIKYDDKLLTDEAYTGCLFSSYPAYFTYQYKFKSGAADSTFSEDDLFINKYLNIEKEYSGKTRSNTLRIYINSRIRSLKDATVIKPLLDEYLQKYASQEKAEDIRSLQETYHTATNLSVGHTPPPFVLKDINGKEVTLNDFAGNVIYMDFWASWCGPCRAQMKSAPALHKQFEGKEIVFLYINMDEKIDLGKQAIEEDKIEGIQLFSGGFKADNPIVKAFNITGIPRYLIIGKDGKILDNNAPRPNEDITRKYLNDALNKVM